MGRKHRIGIVGTGLKACDYAGHWLGRSDIEIVAAADVNADSLKRFAALYEAAGATAPPLFDGAAALIETMSGDIDAVYVSTPHAYHLPDATAVLAAGLDLLLEKPMATSVAEARSLAATGARAPGKVVIAFQSSLSPLIGDTAARASTGEFGDLVSVSATVWEDWSERYAGHWKQVPEISGGGFMFDTGAHMLNAVCMLAGYDFEHVSAYMDRRGKDVDIASAIAARLGDGTPVTLHACGDAPSLCDSRLSFFYSKAIVAFDAWGRWREIHAQDGAVQRREAANVDPMDVFVDVLDGRAPSPSTIEDGYRFAMIWDAIKTSAAHDGTRIAVADMSQDASAWGASA